MLIVVSLATAPGPKDGEGMIGGAIGFMTCPIPIAAAWFLYKFRTCRWIIWPIGLFGAFAFLCMVGLMVIDSI